MKILITGSTGLLGQALSRRLSPSCDVIGLSRHTPSSPGVGRHVACDLLDAARTRELVQQHAPDVVIHTQALSDVDRCEQEPEEARAQNVQTTAHLVRALEGTRTLLVHLSTDYVFDGCKRAPYDETDAPHPISVYGRTKLEAEQAALAAPRVVVVRTGTLFGAARMNFCNYVVEQLSAGRPVQAYTDQVTSPTYTDDLAEGLSELITACADGGKSPVRLCHMTNGGACSRVQFAERVADLLRCPRALIQPTSMATQRRPAPRPAYSAMTTIHLPRVIGRTLRLWDDALSAYLREYHSVN